ncbi:glycosyltransferase family 2 protein [Maribellus sp. YY47]|uniref:glycosyltransferase n=1 Tax=Maribellus sp. YY47 TaxID=2929486 RepID=UPI002000AAA2|nr:glycosyltransferase family 2 protein [Maribellus sp. YY47]MCK3684134.1 glycosyltransferase family 2 protein [Maribellus sp. YY47]
MEAITYIVFVFALVQLAVSLVNLVFRQRLPEAATEPIELVSVLIPARNEEQNIGNLLRDLKECHQNIEVWVYDDQSTDQTTSIVEEISQTDPRIQLLHSAGLPEGWTGKNHACYSLAQKAGGQYLLFLDADVRINTKVIAQSIAMMKSQNLALLSIFPQQVMKTRGEKLTVPVMNYVLLTLLPLILVRKLGFPSLSAANGQFMLFNAETYKKWQPHRHNRNKRVEDIEIARFLKRNNEKIACLTGNDDIRCRMYGGYTDAVNGLSRSVLLFFGNSAPVAILFWLITTFGFVVLTFTAPWEIFVLYLFILGAIRVFVSISSRQAVGTNLILGFMQKINLGIMIGKAIRSRSLKTFEWKGRAVPSS